MLTSNSVTLLITKAKRVPVTPSTATIISNGFYTERAERAERSLQAPPPKNVAKQPPPKKCREVSTTVVLNQGGFDEVISRVRWTLNPSELKKKGQKKG